MQNFYKIFKIFQKSLMSTLLLIVLPPEPNLWRCHCSTGLEWKSCMKFCPRFPPPNQNPGAATALYTIKIFITLTLFFLIVLNQPHHTRILMFHLRLVTNSPHRHTFSWPRAVFFLLYSTPALVSRPNESFCCSNQGYTDQ